MTRLLPLAFLLALPVQAEVRGGFQLVASHHSDPTASRRTDCSSDFVGPGAYLQWKGLELEGALGARRTLCGSVRETTPGGYASMKWRPKLRRK